MKKARYELAPRGPHWGLVRLCQVYTVVESCIPGTNADSADVHF